MVRCTNRSIMQRAPQVFSLIPAASDGGLETVVESGGGVGYLPSSFAGVRSLFSVRNWFGNVVAYEANQGGMQADVVEGVCRTMERAAHGARTAFGVGSGYKCCPGTVFSAGDSSFVCMLDSHSEKVWLLDVG